MRAIFVPRFIKVKFLKLILLNGQIEIYEEKFYSLVV